MRLYVPAAITDLRDLEQQGRLPDDNRLVRLAVTDWAMAELHVDDPEDETAEFVVLEAAAKQQVDGATPAAVLVFDMPLDASTEVRADGLQVQVGADLPRRRLVALHLTPDLRWYAGHELPDVLVALS